MDSKKNSKIKMIGLCIAGGVFAEMAVACLIVSLIVRGDDDGVVVPIVFGVMGAMAALGCLGMFLGVLFVRRRMRKYDTYKKIMAGKKSVTLDGLAKTMGIPQHRVVADLQQMMDNGEFEFGYIDCEYGLFTLADDRLEYDRLKHRKVFKCKSCGAFSAVYDGETKICSYCGGALEDTPTQTPASV